MALQDLLNLSNQRKKIGISQERVEAVLPIVRQYVAFWREYPDIFIDFMVRGNRQEPKDGEFQFYFYQRVFLRSVMRYQYVYAVFILERIYLLLLVVKSRGLAFYMIK